MLHIDAGTYHSLRGALSSLGPSSATTDTFRHLLTKYPLLTLHYASLNFRLNGDITVSQRRQLLVEFKLWLFF